MKEIWELFWTFAKMGVMTFGGGMAMLPILQREVVENKHWATEEELADYYAIGQCTPGIIAVNTATFIGQKYSVSVPGRHLHPGRADYEFLPSGLGTERFRRHPGLRVRADSERGFEAAEKVRGG